VASALKFIKTLDVREANCKLGKKLECKSTDLLKSGGAFGGDFSTTTEKMFA
jgi:hypothetical protein